MSTPDKGTRFAIIGYTYGLFRTPEARNILIDRVNGDEVDHVFILGDSDLWDDEVVSQYTSGFKAAVHFAPGNHETQDDEREEEEQHDHFLANVGYDNKAFSERDIKDRELGCPEHAQAAAIFAGAPPALAGLQARRADTGRARLQPPAAEFCAAGAG